MLAVMSIAICGLCTSLVWGAGAGQSRGASGGEGSLS